MAGTILPLPPEEGALVASPAYSGEVYSVFSLVLEEIVIIMAS